ncbi:MAG: alpha/beta hydrolase [Bacteroidales bacterium]|nr:alpha/beta hydrolase [Bacteroidales bacterium]
MKLKDNKHLWIIISTSIILVAAVCFIVTRSCSSTNKDIHPSDKNAIRFISNGHSNPLSDSLLCLNSTLLISVDSDTAFVTIDSLSMGYASGRYYVLKSDEPFAAPETYSITIHRRSSEINLNGTTLELDLEDSDIEELLDGACHRVSLIHGSDVMISVNDYIDPAFHESNDQRLRQPIFKVKTQKNITYGQAVGYWTSMVGNDGEGFKAILADWLKKDHRPTPQQLTLDLYQPDDTIQRSHPLILFLHGGAFFFGDKSDSAITQWCRYYASLGYVTASMNYRMGFPVSKDGIERTGYMAVQDAHAAMRYLLANDSLGFINRDQLFVAGTSAGSITALNLTFMTNATRPSSSFKKKGRFTDLGPIDGSGNDFKADFKIRAIANMWGAVTDLDLLSQSQVSIISFHGDQDKIVPYDKGYPFGEISTLVGKKLFGQMYGSASIHRYALSHGINSKLITFNGYGHSPHIGENNALIPENFNRIQQEIQVFLYRVLVPVEPRIISDQPRHYGLNVDAPEVEWKALGGIILSKGTIADVVWLADASEHLLKASFTHPSGLQYTLKLPIEQ